MSLFSECPAQCKMCSIIDGETRCVGQQCYDGHVLSAVSLACERETPHYNDVTWASWRLKSPATRFFVQQLVQLTTNNIKAPHHWSFLRKSTGNGLIPSQRASDTENVTHPCPGVFMLIMYSDMLHPSKHAHGLRFVVLVIGLLPDK